MQRDNLRDSVFREVSYLDGKLQWKHFFGSSFVVDNFLGRVERDNFVRFDFQ